LTAVAVVLVGISVASVSFVCLSVSVRGFKRKRLELSTLRWVEITQQCVRILAYFIVRWQQLNKWSDRSVRWLIGLSKV